MDFNKIKEIMKKHFGADVKKAKLNGEIWKITTRNHIWNIPKENIESFA